jgi:hypothetical protein
VLRLYSYIEFRIAILCFFSINLLLVILKQYDINLKLFLSIFNIFGNSLFEIVSGKPKTYKTLYSAKFIFKAFPYIILIFLYQLKNIFILEIMYNTGDNSIPTIKEFGLFLAI